MVSLLYDPPEVKQHALRGDPPIDEWPGSVIEREDLMAASGDPRDWFRYGHRLKAYERAWFEFRNARNRRRDFMAGFDWNQILILGEYGSGKTTLGLKLALSFFRLGHPVFSNSSCLFGWHLEADEMYTAMGFMPKSSVLLIDESSATLAGRVGHSVAVASFSEMNLNTRKANCLVIYMTAHDWELAASIRRECKEVWMPVSKDDLEVEDSTPVGRVEPARNPDNFRVAWHVWGDYPYQKANLITGPDPSDKRGFGAPTHTMFDEGEGVRNAFLLNDTFELAKAGAATMASRDVVKGQLADFHQGRGPKSGNGNSGSADARHQQLVEKLLLFLQEQEEQGPVEFFSAGTLARALGIGSGQTGRFLQELLPINSVRGKGYRSADLYRETFAMLGMNHKGSDL